MTDDPFLNRLNHVEWTRRRVQKLIALAENNPNKHEAAAARKRAEELAAKADLDVATIMYQKKRSQIDLTMFRTVSEGLKRRYPGKDDEDYTNYARRHTKGKEDDG